MKGIQTWFGRRPLYQQITSCKAVQIIIGYCSISTAFHHQMVLDVYDCEKLLHPYQVLWSKHMDKMGDFRLLPQSRWELRSSGLSHSELW